MEEEVEKLFQVWETPLLPRQVLDKLEIKGFKVSLNLKMVQSYSDFFLNVETTQLWLDRW